MGAAALAYDAALGHGRGGVQRRFAEDPHDLWIRRGGTTYKFDQVQNGEAATKNVALVAGTWKLWSNIDGHEQLGMVAHVTVSDG